VTPQEGKEFLVSIFDRIRVAASPDLAWQMLTNDEVWKAREALVATSTARHPGAHVTRAADAELLRRGLTQGPSKRTP